MLTALPELYVLGGGAKCAAPMYEFGSTTKWAREKPNRKNTRRRLYS